MKLTLKDVKRRLARAEEKKEDTPKHEFEYVEAPLPMDLGRFCLADGLWYVPEYVDAGMEVKLRETILSQAANTWIPVRGRRLQMWGGSVTPSGLQDPQPLPLWLDILADRLHREAVFPQRPNHVLVNDYQPGEGIMPHTDGPAYYPQVAIVSLGSATTFQFWTMRREPYMSLVAEPGSLLLFSKALYTDYLHGIEAKPVDDWYTDGCGKRYTEVGGQLSEIVNNRSDLQAPPVDSEYSCPTCSGTLLCCGGLVRARRVSLTIRIVPPLRDSGLS